jgi:hypothetical protein
MIEKITPEFRTAKYGVERFLKMIKCLLLLLVSPEDSSRVRNSILYEAAILFSSFNGPLKFDVNFIDLF